MLLKKYYIYAFIFIGLLPALFLYYTDRPVNFFVAEDDISEPDPAGICSEDEGFDYYTLIYTKEKGSAFEIGDKADYFAEPEPEPEPEPKPAAQPKPSGGSTSISQKEQQMVNYINEARRNAGLLTLQVSSQLTTAARAKSKDMVNNNYFDHHSPIYGGLAGLFSSFGIRYRAAGENLAMNSSGSVYEAHNLLFNSPGHRSNILSPDFSVVGVGIHVKGDGTHYYTQLFVGN